MMKNVDEMLNKTKMLENIDEAGILCKYITGRELNDSVSNRYYKIICVNNRDFSDIEKKIWRIMMRKSWVIPYVDGGLRFLKPYSEIRKRLYIMLCLLETQPDYADYFIVNNKNRLKSYVNILFYGIRGIYFSFAGYIYLRLCYGRYI